MERVLASALAFACVQGDVRKALLRRFPYAIYFRVLDEQIVELAVLHGRRHPGRWQCRQ